MFPQEFLSSIPAPRDDDWDSLPAPADCVIEEVLVKDGEAVGVGAPLFRIRRV